MRRLNWFSGTLSRWIGKKVSARDRDELRTAGASQARRYGAGEGEGATVLVVCGGVPDGDGLAVGDGATVFVVCGWLPEGEALASGVTVVVGAGEDCSGVTVAVGRGPAGTLGFRTAVGLGSASVCATTCVTISESTVAPTIPNAILDPKDLIFFMRIQLMTANIALAQSSCRFLQIIRDSPPYGICVRLGNGGPIQLALRVGC